MEDSENLANKLDSVLKSFGKHDSDKTKTYFMQICVSHGGGGVKTKVNVLRCKS